MQINSLKLLNYRNYETLDINFSNNINIIYGKNGMGKTNLIEAIYILALTKTFRAGNEELKCFSTEIPLSTHSPLKFYYT